jgi:outer membrane receptor for ferrienterochelin and colicins
MSPIYRSQGQTLFFPEFNSPFTNHGIAVNTDAETHDQALANLGFHGFTFQGLFGTRDKAIPTAYFGTLFNDPRTRNYNNHQYFDLGYQHSIVKGWQLELRTAYDQYRLQAFLAYSPRLADEFSTRGNWWTGDAKLTCTLMERQKLTFGTEITDNLRQDEGDFVATTNLFTLDAANSTVWALYAQDDLTVTRELSLSGGVRYDRYSNFGGTTNPRLALIYHAFQPTTFKLLYGSAFRAPNVFEMYPDLGTIYDDNAALLPELVRSEELVVEQQLGERFRLIGDLFHNNIDRLISLETNPSDGNFVYLNSGGAVAEGIAIEVEGRFGNGLQGKASFHYNHVGSAPHLVLDNSPQELGKLNLIVPLSPKKLFASLDAQYTSPRQTVAGNAIAGFAVFNATLLGHSLGKHLDLSGSFYNILNKKYFDPGRPEDVENAIQQDGRNFRIKIIARF